VSSQASAASHRGGTLTVLQDAPFGSLDPARPGSVDSLLALSMTNDGLTAFKRVGGSDGAQLVPDLAVSLPTPTDGGLTYTFRLRPGIRYSDGQPVRPEDFRRAIERDFRLGNGAPIQTFATPTSRTSWARRHALLARDGARCRAQLWAKADRQFTDQAPIISLATPSRRVGNYEYNPYSAC
jgi:ABC-type transport system substrate-binding protein